MRRALVLVVALALAAPSAGLGQQTALVTRNLKLHSAPQASAKILDSLSEGEIVTILRHEHRTGYYHVITQNQTVGWLSDRYVHLIADPAEVHQPSGAPGSVESAAATVAVAAGDFDTCPDSGKTQVARIRLLNRLKNRSAAPGASDIDSSVTLGAMLAARSPRESLRAEPRRVEPGLMEVSLVNDGELDISSRLAVEVRWSDARLVAGDGLQDFELAEQNASAARFQTKSNSIRLPAGDSLRLGWLRFDRDCEVRCELKKL